MDQKCPICGKNNKICFKEYSFCRCWNIFYTDWSNIDQKVYNEKYKEKYEDVKYNIGRYVDRYFSWLRPEGTFLEIGSVNDIMLEEAHKFGFKPLGLDIINRESNYPFLWADFENFPIIFTENGETECHPRDIKCIWASHIFEHFYDPIKCLKICLVGLKYFAMIVKEIYLR